MVRDGMLPHTPIHHPSPYRCPCPYPSPRENPGALSASETSKHAVNMREDYVGLQRLMVYLFVEANGFMLCYVSKDARTNPAVVWAAVRSNPHALFFASKELRGDVDLARLALSQGNTSSKGDGDRPHGDAMRGKGSGRLKQVLASPSPSPATFTLSIGTCEKRFGILKCLSASLRDDKEIVKLAVARRGLDLKYASARLRDDKQVVMQVSWPFDT